MNLGVDPLSSKAINIRTINVQGTCPQYDGRPVTITNIAGQYIIPQIIADNIVNILRPN